MCTDKTLKEHIKKYKDTAAEIKRLEEVKKKEADYILAEYSAREEPKDFKKTFGVSVINSSRTDIRKKEFKEEFPEIYSRFAYKIEYRYLR